MRHQSWSWTSPDKDQEDLAFDIERITNKLKAKDINFTTFHYSKYE
jgi:hypothetical protein